MGVKDRNDTKEIRVEESGKTLPLDFGVFNKSKTDKYTERSLLRYPGGKFRAVKLITSLIPGNITKLCSPFIGGGSIELACAARGIQVSGYDVFQPLVEFWQHTLAHPAKLAGEVEKYYPLAKEDFYKLQKTQTEFSTSFERAAVFYVLNRSSYSGSTLSGGMSPNHPRFTPSSIDRLRQFYNPNLTVKKADFIESISENQEIFLYLDPPYLIESNLYGRNGDAHKNFNHQLLHSLLTRRQNWILSYNNTPKILEMYRDYTILFPHWKYGMSQDKKSKEVLVLSPDIARVHNLNK